MCSLKDSQNVFIQPLSQYKTIILIEDIVDIE